MPRLKDKYHKEVVPRLMELSQFKNIMQVPALEKITVNIGMGEALDTPNSLDAAVKDLTAITGQKPVVVKAKHLNCKGA
jgi:large subunit ribosomal protein L5